MSHCAAINQQKSVINQGRVGRVIYSSCRFSRRNNPHNRSRDSFTGVARMDTTGRTSSFLSSTKISSRFIMIFSLKLSTRFVPPCGFATHNTRVVGGDCGFVVCSLIFFFIYNFGNSPHAQQESHRSSLAFLNYCVGLFTRNDDALSPPVTELLRIVIGISFV